MGVSCRVVGKPNSSAHSPGALSSRSQRSVIACLAVPIRHDRCSNRGNGALNETKEPHLPRLGCVVLEGEDKMSDLLPEHCDLASAYDRNQGGLSGSRVG